MYRVMHLDAPQGNNEQRASRMIEYGERVAQAIDAAVRQKELRHFWLCRKTGRSGA